jgi:hypothetical protein
VASWWKTEGRTEVTEKDDWGRGVFGVIPVDFLDVIVRMSPDQPARLGARDDPSIVIVGIDEVEHLLRLLCPQRQEGSYSG